MPWHAALDTNLLFRLELPGLVQAANRDVQMLGIFVLKCQWRAAGGAEAARYLWRAAENLWLAPGPGKIFASDEG